jgi:ferredoxin
VVGDPGRESPVLVTGNYDLTVRRLLRALVDVDAWVVVASSAGINVWCAASGGHLGTHQIVTALKVSGVADRVAHRRAILPQLAATGVEAREVRRRSGWTVRFGPVRAEDLPRYLREGQRKDESMRRVRFGLPERVEMAVAWAAPTSLLIATAAALLRPNWALPLVAMSFSLAFAVFVLLDRLPHPRRAVFAAAAASATAITVVVAGGSSTAVVGGVVACAALTAVLTFDYSGSTPVEGGSHFAERDWHVVLDRDRCRGVYKCWEVCPEACFEKRQDQRQVEMTFGDRCVRCGACVVQCPMDALAFEDREGQRIAPEVIRRYKLNLFGSRGVDAAAAGGAEPGDGERGET